MRLPFLATLQVKPGTAHFCMNGTTTPLTASALG